jgi:hypothetical protein
MCRHTLSHENHENADENLPFGVDCPHLEASISLPSVVSPAFLEKSLPYSLVLPAFDDAKHTTPDLLGSVRNGGIFE